MSADETKVPETGEDGVPFTTAAEMLGVITGISQIVTGNTDAEQQAGWDRLAVEADPATIRVNPNPFGAAHLSDGGGLNIALPDVIQTSPKRSV